jgi:hypothetical protein
MTELMLSVFDKHFNVFAPVKKKQWGGQKNEHGKCNKEGNCNCITNETAWFTRQEFLCSPPSPTHLHTCKHTE